jgi:multicomponent Na+:H+ antiporter subunit F
VTGALAAAAAAILASMIVALVRVGVGPTPFDRMLAAQIVGSGGVAILALLAFALEAPALVDAALARALLAAIAAVAFVRRARPGASR